MNTECVSDDELAQWSTGTVQPERVSALTAHVGSCETCRVILSELLRTDGRRPSSTVGRYHLETRIGSGGMGVVWAAFDPKLGRRVAVKILHQRSHGPERTRRFVLERELLATLDHPGIARLLDGGETEEGQPFFVMELIEGQSIDRALDERRATVRQRVELMREVCAAVAYAHRHLIVHRDLKPANVLVDAHGQPKLVDFGIAKLLQSDVKLTQTGLAPMTPAYAAPEQVRNEPVTTSSDVYALGVLLFELLSGRGPYTTTPGDVDGVLRAVVSQEPVALPSALADTAVVTAASRSTTLEALRRTLSGDLEAVVGMALRKDPKDRYRSVEALDDDLAAWLEGRPTAARRSSRAYRAVLFVRRHKVAVAAAMAAFGALTVGLATTAYQARLARLERDRAARRFEQVRSLARAVLFDYHDAIAELPGSTPVRERLVKGAVDYLDSLAKEVEGEPELERELASAYLKVGEVQGDPAGASLGDTAAAMESYSKARLHAERLLAMRPKDVTARSLVATSLAREGSIIEVSGDLTKARERIRQSHAINQALVDENPRQEAVVLDLSSDELALGQLSLQLGEEKEALDHLQKSLELRRSVPATRRPLKRTPGVPLLYLSDIAKGQGELDRSLALAEEAAAEFETPLKADPKWTLGRRGLSAAQGRMQGVYRLRKEYDRALVLAKKVLEQAEADAKADPQNVVLRRDLYISQFDAAHALDNDGKPGEGLLLLAQARKSAEELSRSDPSNVQTRYDLLKITVSEGYTAASANRFEESLRAFLAVVEQATALIALDPKGQDARDNLFDGHHGAAEVLCELGRHSDAEAHFAQAVAVGHELIASGADKARRQNRLAGTLGAWGRWGAIAARKRKGTEGRTALAEVKAHLQQSVELFEALKRDDNFFPTYQEEFEKVAAELKVVEAELRGKSGPAPAPP